MSVDAMTDRDVFGPSGHAILRDWAEAGALVTLTLRNGVQFTGHVRKQQAPDLPSRVVGLVGEHAAGSGTVEHDVLLSEVVAITAKAQVRIDTELPDDIVIAPGLSLVHAWAHPALWYWLCVECENAFGPLTGREGAETGAREHRHGETVSR